MKTQLVISSLKILAIITVVAATLNIKVLAQPKHDKVISSPEKVTEQLDYVIKSVDRSMKYVAPEEINSEKEGAMDELDILMGKIEEDIKYSAPEELEHEALQYLETLAENINEIIMYRAPSSADATEELVTMGHLDRNSRPVKVEVFSPQDQWLISAGYLKATRTPAWEKVKRAFGSRSGDKEYANKF